MNHHRRDLDWGEAIAWVQELAQAAVFDASVLPGGMSSLILRCSLDDGRDVVVRHITDADWLRSEPHLISNEATALMAARTAGVSVPTLFGLAPERGLLAMSWVDAAMHVDGGALADRAGAIATAAARIASVPLPPGHCLLPWRSWAPPDLELPSWGDEALWAHAIALWETLTTPRPDEPVLLHRDLHPLNMLWDRQGGLTLVDWVNACVGHPHAELGHCRWNLAVLAGQDVAGTFLGSYLDQTSFGPYSPYWDLATVMGFLPGPPEVAGWHAVGRTDLTSAVVIARTEDFLRQAVDAH